MEPAGSSEPSDKLAARYLEWIEDAMILNSGEHLVQPGQKRCRSPRDDEQGDEEQEDEEDEEDDEDKEDWDKQDDEDEGDAVIASLSWSALQQGITQWLERPPTTMVELESRTHLAGQWLEWIKASR